MKRLFNLHRYPLYAKKLYWEIASKAILGQKGISKTGSIVCYGLPIITLSANSHIIFGTGIALHSDTNHTALGVSHPVILRALLLGASIAIGDKTGMSGTTVCAARSVCVGNRCLIGADVVIADTDFHPIAMEDRRYKGFADAILHPFEIEEDVFIGARAIILKEVKIGEGSVVGAGSVVTTDVPTGVVVAGNPARIVSKIQGPAY